MDVSSIQVPSGSYARGTILNISVRAQASAGTSLGYSFVVTQPFCADSPNIVLNLSSGTNTDGTFTGQVNTGICKRAGESILWPVGKSYLAMYISGGNGTTSFVAGEFYITN